MIFLSKQGFFHGFDKKIHDFLRKNPISMGISVDFPSLLRSVRYGVDRFGSSTSLVVGGTHSAAHCAGER